MMTVKTHNAYAEGFRQPDGTFNGRIYSFEGEMLHSEDGLKDKKAYTKWVAGLEKQYRKEGSE